MNGVTLIIRWLCWILLITLESVVGFPWLSLYVAGEWIFAASPQTALLSLVVMSVVFSAVYWLPLTVSALLLVLIWQVQLRTRKNTSQRWATYLGSALVIGLFAHLPLNGLVAVSTLVSFIVFFKLSGGKIVRQPWQTTKLTHSSDT